MSRNGTDSVPSIYSLLLPWVTGTMVAACILALASRYFEDYIVKVIGLGILFLAILGTLIQLYRAGKIPFR